MNMLRPLPIALLFAASLGAQGAPQQTPRPLQAGIVIGGGWLQANDASMDRDAFPSASADISLRRSDWSFNAGWLRIAREFSTVQGGTLGVGRIIRTGPVLFIPNIALLGGQTYSSRDTTGYDFVDPATGATGHVPRYSYSDGAAFGGGVGLNIELPIYRILGLRVGVSEWYFSGTPLEGDRTRTVVGVGLSLRVLP